MQERVFRGLVRHASTDLRFSRQDPSILWAVNFRSWANGRASYASIDQILGDFLSFHLHTRRCQ